MNVLFLIHSLEAGGAERVIVNLSNHWVERGWEVTVVTLAGSGMDFYAIDERVQRVALGVARASPGPLAAIKNNMRSIMAVRRALQLFNPDVAVGVMTISNVYLALAGAGLPILRVGTEHTHPPRRSIGVVWRLARKLTYGCLHAVVALTDRTQKWLMDNTRARVTSVIPNPVSWPILSEGGSVSPSKCLRPGGRLLLAVGRLVGEKGFDLLIPAFARARENHPDWSLVILGEGPQRCVLERQIEGLGLESNVTLVGRVGNVGDWYEAADLYVLSSRVEGFPNTLIEAMAAGLCVVSFDCETGPSDIIETGSDGILVEPENIDALAKELNYLMGDEQLRNCLAQRAMEVRTRFSLSQISGRWECLFEHLKGDRQTLRTRARPSPNGEPGGRGESS